SRRRGTPSLFQALSPGAADLVSLDRMERMARSSNVEIREAILAVAEFQRPRDHGGNLQSGSVLAAVLEKLAPNLPRDSELEEAILTQFHDLLCTGIFAWGLNLSNPNPPFFHFTDRGRKALERLSRDPSNPGGYLRSLSARAVLNPVANSYLLEALDCYNSNLLKASAVMMGCTAESIVLNLRDELVKKLKSLGHAVPTKLNEWRVKTVLDTLFSYLDSKKSVFSRELREEFEAYWNAFGQQIRTTRNDAGHPTSVDPVTEDSVHASFLIFPEQAALAGKLQEWITNDLR
ncbi:MAG: hypothetical protein ACREBC_30995, partial [Pyrinomonadaceae bacterium]